MQNQNQLLVALIKWSKVRDGEREIFSDLELDALSDHFNPLDTPESTTYFRDFATEINKKGVGTLDRYIGFIK